MMELLMPIQSFIGGVMLTTCALFLVVIMADVAHGVRIVYEYLSERTQERISNAFDKARWWILKLMKVKAVLVVPGGVLVLYRYRDAYMLGSFFALYLFICTVIVAWAYTIIAAYFYVRSYEIRNPLSSPPLSGGDTQVSPRSTSNHQ